MNTAVSRRGFLGGVGAIVATISLGPVDAFAQGPAELTGSLKVNRSLDGWIRVDAAGTITLFTGKVELGQGILTALAQIAAEELDVRFDVMRVVSADTTRSPDEGYTYGSQSVEQSGAAIRVAAAQARHRLMMAAASRLDDRLEDLTVAAGVVTGLNGRHLTYWELAAGKADLLAIQVSADVALKPAELYKIVGQSVQRIDLLPKLTGGQAFIQDLRLPGMLFGRVVRPRRYRAKLLRIDDSGVRKMPGVVAVVREGSFLGVVARREEQAIAARDALAKAAIWDQSGPALPNDQQLVPALKSWPEEVSVVGEKGQATAAPAGRRIKSTFSRPYLSQGSLAPSCGVAWLREGHLTVWSHTQGAFPLRGDIAKALGMPVTSVDTIHTPAAGCYGQNGADDAAFDAALLARAVDGHPVKVQWMREDEFSCPPFGPAMATELQATLSDDGRIVDWVHDVWSNSHAMRPGQPGGINLLAAWQMEKGAMPSPPLRIAQPYGDGDRNAVPLYAFERFKSVNHLLMATPIRNGSLRTLGTHLNVFSIESFVDELALAAGADPAEFRLQHLGDSRARAVIQAAIEKAGWSKESKLSKKNGVGRGVAFARYKNIGAYAAVVADVVVDAVSGDIRVDRLVIAADVGLIINPDGLTSQIEGGAIQAMGWTLKEAVRFNDHEILTRDWSTYQVMRFPDIPKIEVVLLDRPELPSVGGGEASSGPTAAAIANAFTKATGLRIRDLPMNPDRVKAALEKAHLPAG